MPIRIIVRANSKVRTTYDSQIVCGAGMTNGEVIRGVIGGACHLINEGRVGIVIDLSETVIFHHDQEYVS